MSAATVIVELHDRVLNLRLNRPQKKNALTQDMYGLLAEELTRAASEPQIRAVLIDSSGSDFCSGNDVSGFVHEPGDIAASPVSRFMVALRQCPKPVVAAVNGFTVGIGVTMLMHCDLIYAADDTRFRLPFVNLGCCPEFGASLIMPALMGHARAAELLLLGDFFDAGMARDYGLINAVLPAAMLREHARAQALKLAQQPPQAMRVSKALLRRWAAAQLTDVIGIEAEHFSSMLSEPEAQEAIGAFLGKRKADFSKF